MDNTNFFDYSIVSRGRTIFREKSYDIQNETKQSVDAIVHGSNDYRVHLDFNEAGKLLITKSSCTCPCQYPCKHMAALVLHHDQKHREDFASAELNKMKGKNGHEMLNTIERDVKDITAYYSSPYSRTKLISDSLEKIDKLNSQNKLDDCMDQCQSIIEKLISASFKSDSTSYYANYYIEPIALIKRSIRLVNSINFPNKAEIIANSMLNRNSIRHETLKELLTSENSSALVSSAIEYIVKERMDMQFIDAFTSTIERINISSFPKSTIGFFFYNYYDRISRGSKRDYISSVFQSSNENDIKNLINALVRNGEVDLLSFGEIEKLGKIDHKEALRVCLSYKTDYDLIWISYFLKLVKEEDKDEIFQFEATLDNLIKKGIYAPLLLRSSSKVDLRKITIDEIEAILDYIKDEYKPRIVEYVFSKGEKDINMKVDKSGEIAACCKILDKIGPSYCTRLLLNGKIEDKVKKYSKPMAIYFQLLEKYNLLEEKGYKPYRG